jgi:protease-4
VAMKRHPLLFSLLVILIIVVCMSAAIVGLVYLASDREGGFGFGDRIALIDLRGVLADGERLTSLLDVYSKQGNIKAVIIRIDSPGGGVAPAQEIYREIQRIRKQKPVVAYMGNVAASGGYYVACAAEKIVASPGTLTGSIGVIMRFSNWEELLKKLGVDMVVIKSGQFKDIGSPNRKMTREEQDLLDQVVRDVHDQFIRDVAAARKLPMDRVRAIADGRIMTGRQAKELGLVDELGNFKDAVEIAKKLANIKGEVNLTKARDKKPSLWDFLLEDLVRSLINEVEARRVSLKAFSCH